MSPRAIQGDEDLMLFAADDAGECVAVAEHYQPLALTKTSVIYIDPTIDRSRREDIIDQVIPYLTDSASVQVMDEDKVAAASEEPTTVPQLSTPARVGANIGKRRTKIPSLARTTPTPGHSAKMAQIYQTAKKSLRSPRSPSGPRTPDLNRLRISQTEGMQVSGSPMDTVEASPENPFSPTAAIGGPTPTHPPYLPHLPRSVNASVEVSHTGIPARGFEPSSSGVSTPMSSFVTYPTLNMEDIPETAAQLHSQTSEKSSWPSSGSGSTKSDNDGEEQYLMFQGMPLPEPMTAKQLFSSGKGKRDQRGDTWLDHLFEQDTGKEDDNRSMEVQIKSEASNTTPSPEKELGKRIHKTKEVEDQRGKHGRPGLKRFATSDSDKENRRPGSSPGRQTPPGDLRRVRLGALRSILGTSPKSAPVKRQTGTLLSVPATRFQPFKRPSKFISPQTPSPNAGAKVEKTEPPTPQHTNDDYKDVPLSPHVDIYRKDNRPKRARCPSYFDADIFGDLPEHPTPLNNPEEGTAQHSPVHGDGRKILGESAAQTYLTRPQPFCKEAEEYDFKGL